MFFLFNKERKIFLIEFKKEKKNVYFFFFFMFNKVRAFFLFFFGFSFKTGEKSNFSEK